MVTFTIHRLLIVSKLHKIDCNKSISLYDIVKKIVCSGTACDCKCYSVTSNSTRGNEVFTFSESTKKNFR